MTNSVTNSKTEVEVIPNAENHKGIENHKKAATHFEAAAKSHHEAALHHTNGNHDNAAKSTVEAHGHSSLANDAQKEDVRHHTAKL